LSTERKGVPPNPNSIPSAWRRGVAGLGATSSQGFADESVVLDFGTVRGVLLDDFLRMA
jgi:hypothetical protein